MQESQSDLGRMVAECRSQKNDKSLPWLWGRLKLAKGVSALRYHVTVSPEHRAVILEYLKINYGQPQLEVRDITLNRVWTPLCNFLPKTRFPYNKEGDNYLILKDPTSRSELCHICESRAKRTLWSPVFSSTVKNLLR